MYMSRADAEIARTDILGAALRPSFTMSEYCGTK
jgi:hypothetical protein